MIERSDEHVGNVGTRNSIARRQRERMLGHVDGVATSLGIRQSCGANDPVTDIARSNLVFRTSAPNQRVALVRIQEKLQNERP